MQKHGRQLRLIVSIISNIVVLILVVQLLNFAYAQISATINGSYVQLITSKSLHQKTLYQYIPSKQNAGIPVGKFPSSIGVDEATNRVYVTNSNALHLDG
jgi:hypothetical protein